VSEPLPWWKTGALFLIYPRSFRDASGDGVGDLPGILEKLDHLVELGVDALWLSPFYPSPQVDFGYDVADHCDVDPMFGTLADFDRLGAAAHHRGLRVVVDWVLNHTSDQHPWFLASRSRRDDPKRGFYTWRDPAPGGGPPNNWVSVFGGPSWTFDAITEQYYLHSFHAAQPDLDWRNPEVEAAMFDVLRFWLARGVDGFRIDAPEFIGKDPLLRDNPLRLHHEPHRRGVLRPYDALEHVHDKDHPDLHAILRRMRAVVDVAPDRVTIGEVRVREREQWAAYLGQDDEMHLAFDFGPLKADFDARSIRRAVEATLAALPPGHLPAIALGNHDEPRICTRYGRAGARMAAVLLCTLPGTPCLYYGDELGMIDIEVPPELAHDPQAAVDPTMSRDPCRSPMPWTHAGGFTESASPWLPMGDNIGSSSAEMQRGDPRSMLELYRTLLALRRRHPALHRGSYVAHGSSDDTLWIYERRHADDRIIIALNFGDDARTLPPHARILASTTDAAPLAPHSAVVLG
jgi:alpha-glucosidase